MKYPSNHEVKETTMAFGLGSLFQGPNTGAAQNMFNQAGQAAGQYGSQAGTEGAQLNPFFAQEMKAQHALTPGQENEMMTAAEAGSGGAFGGEQGEMARQAAITGNSTTMGKSLDEIARNRAKAAAGASEGIAAEDIAGAQKLRQEGAAGMQGLYGTNVGAQLGAMKQQGTDIQDASQMDQGWLKPLTGMLGALGGAATGASAVNTSFMK